MPEANTDMQNRRAHKRALMTISGSLLGGYLFFFILLNFPKLFVGLIASAIVGVALTKAYFMVFDAFKEKDNG